MRKDRERTYKYKEIKSFYEEITNLFKTEESTPSFLIHII